MQKPQKSNYTLVKAYRRIALLDIIRKTFESILIKKISAITKIYHLLSDIHFGERRNISIKHVIYFLVEKIYIAWDREKEVFALILDITGAFDNLCNNVVM